MRSKYASYCNWTECPESRVLPLFCFDYLPKSLSSSDFLHDQFGPLLWGGAWGILGHESLSCLRQVRVGFGVRHQANTTCAGAEVRAAVRVKSLSFVFPELSRE